MDKRLVRAAGVVTALVATISLALASSALAVNTSKLAGTIAGPYAVGATVVDANPALGDHLHFDVNYAGFKAFVAPYVYAACYQSGVQVYGELAPASAGVADFVRFGYDSQWSASGGSANCTASLVAYAGLTHGGTLATLSTVTFTAHG